MRICTATRAVYPAQPRDCRTESPLLRNAFVGRCIINAMISVERRKADFVPNRRWMRWV